jgi:radical SAM protein with 4Fe4S-binding SPASM domain
VELGQINRDTFRDVWQKNPKLSQLRERHRIPLSYFEECGNCDYTPFCTGNCPGLAYNLTGEVNQPSPDACLKKFLAEGGKVPAVAKTQNI